MSGLFSSASFTGQYARSTRVSSVSRAVSVYGGAGSSDVRMSSAPLSLMQSSYGFMEPDDLSIIGNEKLVMQRLNDRLASYLIKVRTLEKANTELDLKIRQFIDNKASPKARDYAAYFATISDLQNKIYAAMRLKGGVLLNMENTRLAMEDFRIKYEHELLMRQMAESEIAGLKQLLEELKMSKQELMMTLEGLKEDLAFLKKNHEEDMVAERQKMSGQVNVEVDAVPQEDLLKILAEMREHYEEAILRSRREIELWFKNKTESLKEKVVSQTENLQSSQSEFKSLKSRLQALQIEHQSQQAMKASLESTLTETRTRYSMRLSTYQMQVTSMQEQVQLLHADLARQAEEFNILLDIKTKLEMEIAEYRRLLDGEATTTQKSTSSSTSRTKVITVVEEVVDGKVVSSSTSSFVKPS
ncbi:hypothetical protein QTP70_009319 [Hemibagrus guttatus]|uniref:IF rod domain-containing protein n=1 Tax=Hemibagrus guttatus TaxID=175788 RepID=A0AAE0UMS3_9TELE|nr:hypothetical protein QTP70_009319 [Hemibagrus guttatus]